MPVPPLLVVVFLGLWLGNWGLPQGRATEPAGASLPAELLTKAFTFQGETTHHLICHKTRRASTNCWAVWPPVSVHSAKGISKPAAIKGRLGTFRNHGTLQLTLNGRPLYYFSPDLQSHKKRQATGDELKTFGSIWHIVTAGGRTPSAPASSGSTTPSNTTTTTSPTPYPYP